MLELRECLKMKALASLSAFVFSAAQVLWIALFPFLAEKLSLSLSTIIASFGLGSFLFVFGSPYWAAKSDLYGRGKILSLGLAALFVSFALLVFLVVSPFQAASINCGFLFLSRLIYGLIASAIVPVAQAIQADSAGSESMSKAMATHSMSLGLGRVAGLTLLIFPQVMEAANGVENVLFLVLGAVAVTSVLSFLTGQALDISHSTRAEDMVQTRSWVSELSDIKFVVLIAFLFASFVEAVNSSLAGRVQALFQLDGLAAGRWSAKMLLAASIGIVLVQGLYRVLSRKERRQSLSIALGIGVAALFFGSILFVSAGTATEFVFAISFFVIGIGLIPPVYLSLLKTTLITSRGGRRAGVVGSAQTLGYAFGAGLSALTFRSGTIEAGHVLCLIVLLLAVTCVLQTKAATL